MTRDEIERQLDANPDLNACGWFDEIVDFALSIHDAVKEEDAQISDDERQEWHNHDCDCCGQRIAVTIRASKVNK